VKFIKEIFLLFLVFNFLLSNEYSYKDIPFQESGRIKPMGTYADNQLLVLYGKKVFEKDENKIAAVDWILDSFTKPSESINDKVFYISNWENSPEVEVSLGLDRNDHHKYSFLEIINGLKNNQELIEQLKNKSEEEQTPVEKQIVAIYNKIVHYDEMVNGMICLLPIIEVQNQTIKDYLELDRGNVSYSFFMRNIQKFRVLLEDLLNTKEEDWTEAHFDLSKIAMQLQNITQYSYAQNVKIIPSENEMFKGTWFSPWEILNNAEITDNQKNLLMHYENFFSAHLDNNMDFKNKHASKIVNLVSVMDGNLKPNLLSKETRFHKMSLFFKSMLCYFLAFFIIGLSWMFKPVLFRKVSLGLVAFGFLLHAYGLSLRMIIMQRPPVTTLYESILFVGFILVLCSLIFEYVRKDTIGLLIAAIGGTMLHFVGLKYAAEGDTMGMLVAVLNSNFWLATHVTTITIGYGVSLVAGLMGHIYLIYAAIKPSDNKELTKIFNNIYGLTLMALFFTMFGTILGGIWADQSWGRFWGWDPKENGALLIVLWHLMMLHMRISGVVRKTGFAYGVSLVNIVVVIAWFGVNLLNVGLHSYGFTDNVATNLFLFIFAELVVTSGLYILIKKKRIKNG